MNQAKFYIQSSNRYGDNWVTIIILSKKCNPLVARDFHCDLLQSLLAYLEERLQSYSKITSKTARDELELAMQRYGVGVAESKKRNDIWWGR